MTALTVAGLTLREAARRRVVWALLVLTVVLLALSAWGFSKLVGLGVRVHAVEPARISLEERLLAVLRHEEPGPDGTGPAESAR